MTNENPGCLYAFLRLFKIKPGSIEGRSPSTAIEHSPLSKQGNYISSTRPFVYGNLPVGKRIIFKSIALGIILVIAMSLIPISNVLSDPFTPTSVYTIHDLGILGVDFSAATAINNNGQIIGHNMSGVQSYFHSFLWENGEITDLGTLGGLFSISRGINDDGQIVGFSQNGDGITRAFLWENGEMSELGIQEGNYSSAMDINEAGIIVGGLKTTTSGEHAFKLENGVITDLGTLSSDYERTAMGLNNNGIVVGVSLGSTGYHAFRYEDGVMTGLGTLGGPKSQALAVNDLGLIVGDAFIDGYDVHAFLWESGVMIDLGALGWHNRSAAYAINNSGLVVGRSFIIGGGDDRDAIDSRAVIWEDELIIDLNTWLPINSGWFLISAMGINDHGDIVGYGEINGEIHAFLLTSSSTYPRPTNTIATPSLTNTPRIAPIPTPTQTPVKLFLAQIRQDPSPTPSPK